jgi:hypothetical protein
VNNLEIELHTVKQQLQTTEQVNDILAKENKEIKEKMAEMNKRMQFLLTADEMGHIEQALTVRNMEADYEIVK